MKPYFSEDGIVIYHGDCREILPQLGRVDLVLSDPPYGVDKDSWDGYLPLDWLYESARISNVIAVLPGISNLLCLPPNIVHLRYRWTLSVRINNGMTRGDFGFGNWIACVVYARSDVSLHSNSQDSTEISINGDKPEHPSPKPISAMKWILRRFEGNQVLDPHMGSGSTLLAAKELRWNGIGIEREEKYCEIAAKRLSQKVLNFDIGASQSISGDAVSGEGPKAMVDGQ